MRAAFLLVILCLLALLADQTGVSASKHVKKTKKQAKKQVIKTVAAVPIPTITQAMINSAVDFFNRFGRVDVVKILNGTGDVNVKVGVESGLNLASREGNVDAVKVLLARGANIEDRSYDFRTPLLSASLNGHTDVVRALIDKGAKTNAVDDKGATSLWLATSAGHLDTVKVLVDKVHDVNVRDRGTQRTPLGIATDYVRFGGEYPAIVDFLKSHGGII